ncbi:autotransporter domain-containing protein [Planctomycetota bacterium]|nr:autotransporter domain-containing protein [Planctomycetota bacterium]
MTATLTAQTFTFNAPDGDNVWTTDSNWEGGSAPGTNVGGALFITAGDVTGGSPAIPITGINLDYTNISQLVFTAAGVTNNYDLQGTGSFTFNDDADIINQKTFTNTISVDIVGTGDRLNITSDEASIEIAGNVDLSDTGGVNLNFETDSAILEVDGVISGTGGSVTINTATSDGIGVNLFGSNTYTGGTTLGGNVNIDNNSAFGTGAITVNDDSNLSNLAGASLTLDNNINITLGSTLTYNDDDNLILDGIISGSNTFAKGGSSTLTINGSNTISGNFNFSGGTVIAGNNAAFGTADVNITSNTAIQSDSDLRSLTNDFAISSGATMTYSGSSNLAISGVISGSGAINMTTSSTLLLSGNNTYSGGTTFTTGTLSLNNDNALGTGTLTLSGNGTIQSTNDNRNIANNINTNGNSLTFQGVQAITLSGVISGSGDITRSASGTLTLTGANTFTGGIDNAQGTIIAGNNNALGTGTLTASGDTTLQSSTDSISLSNAMSIDAGQDLTIGGTNDIALTGIISGAGNFAITKSDLSDVAISGANTYTGTTTLSGGTTIFGNDDAYSSSAVSITANHGFQSTSEDRDVDNDISIGGSATLSFTGDNDMELSGTLSGTGDISVINSGNTLTLSNNNTFSGDLNIFAGTVDLTGSVDGNVIINNTGSVLAGTGTVGGNVTNNGFIAPGTSPGTLSITGDYTQGSLSFYLFEIADTGTAGTDYDLIDVTGSATLAGTIIVLPLDSYEPEIGDTFTAVQTGGGITGEYDFITSGLPAMFSVEQSVSGNDLILEVVEQPLGEAVTARNLVFAAEAFQRIRNSSPTGDLETVIDELETLAQQPLEIAFEQIVPNYLVTQSEATFKGIDVQNNNINGRLNELRYGLPRSFSNNLQIQKPENAETPVDPETAIAMYLQVDEQQQALEQQQETFRFGGAGKGLWSSWVSGFGTFGDFDPALSQAGYEFNTGGVTFGFDYRLMETLAAGAFVGYSNTGTTVDGGQGSNYANTINSGLYMTWFNEEGFYVSGLFGGGVNFYENNRRIVFGNIDRVAESSATGFYLQALASGGYEYAYGNWGFGPQLALQYVNLQIGSHSESGADSLNLDVGAFQGNSFVTRLGGRITYKYETPDLLLVPELVGFWQHEYLSNFNTVTVGVPSGSESFAYTGIEPSRDSGLLGVNLIGISHDSPLTFSVQYNVEFIPNEFIVNNIFAGLRITF